MDKDLLLSFLHAHLKLIFLILKTVNMVSGLVKIFFDLFDL